MILIVAGLCRATEREAARLTERRVGGVDVGCCERVYAGSLSFTLWRAVRAHVTGDSPLLFAEVLSKQRQMIR